MFLSLSVIADPALLPITTFSVAAAVITASPARAPITTDPVAAVPAPALYPKTTLYSPSVKAVSVLWPNAVLYDPVVIASPAKEPINTFFIPEDIELPEL